MKKLLPLMVFCIVAGAFAETEESQSSSTLQITDSDVPKIELRDVETTTAANSGTVEQIQVIQEATAIDNSSPAIQPEMPQNTQTQIIPENATPSTDQTDAKANDKFQFSDVVSSTQNFIENAVETVHDASEEIEDAAGYIHDVCDTYLDSNNNEPTVQTPEQKDKLQQLFETIVLELQKQGLDDKQISEIFDAIATMKKQGFSAQQIEAFIKGLILAAQTPESAKPVIDSYWKKIIQNPIATGIGGLLIGGIITAIICKVTSSSTAKKP